MKKIISLLLISLAPIIVIWSAHGRANGPALLQSAPAISAGEARLRTPAQLAAVPDPATVEEIPIKFAEASSILSAQLGGHPKDFFGPRKAIDNDWTTCWAEGVAGIGAGEWIKVVWLTKEVPAYVAVLPGWAKSKARWENNPRLREIEIILSDGVRQVAAFEDHMQMQFVKLTSDQPAEWAKLVIRAVYPGKKFEDTSISEIKVFRLKK